MSLREHTVITGVACDVRGCTAQRTIGKAAPVFSQAVREFERLLLRIGWVKRYTRSVRWYCPDHAHMGTRCKQGCSGQENKYSSCPNHGNGQVWTKADVISGRFR